MKHFALAALVALCACGPRPDQPPAASPAAVAVVDAATVETPQAGARVTSPLQVVGTAPANWYFENQFPVRLVGADGQDIAFAPAHPRVNWTENAEPKVFDATLEFQVDADTEATLVLQEDMPREGEAARETRIPVTLAARR